MKREWRREWDSNPRWTRAHAGFQDRCLKPLGHPSEPRFLSLLRCSQHHPGRFHHPAADGSTPSALPRSRLQRQPVPRAPHRLFRAASGSLPVRATPRIHPATFCAKIRQQIGLPKTWACRKFQASVISLLPDALPTCDAAQRATFRIEPAVTSSRQRALSFPGLSPLSSSNAWPWMQNRSAAACELLQSSK
jgi:hypothetical protein